MIQLKTAYEAKEADEAEAADKAEEVCNSYEAAVSSVAAAAVIDEFIPVVDLPVVAVLVVAAARGISRRR